MPLRKPTNGHPSQTAAILALRGDGLSNTEIADQLHISQNAVNAITSRRKSAKGSRTVLIPIEVLDELDLSAQARGITANELARRIVETAVEDDMVDAILDDGVAA